MRATPNRRKPSAPAIAHAIAIGALRYFLLRFTRSTVIAFDFKDALSFEGETGPYVQYAVVRVNGILRKGAAQHPESKQRTPRTCRAWSAATIESRISGVRRRLTTYGMSSFCWPASLDARMEAAIATQEPRVSRALRLRTRASLQRLLPQAPQSSKKTTRRSARSSCASRSWCASSWSPRSACSASPHPKKCSGPEPP